MVWQSAIPSRRRNGEPPTISNLYLALQDQQQKILFLLVMYCLFVCVCVFHNTYYIHGVKCTNVCLKANVVEVGD